MLRKRKQTVEPVFGQLKEQQGARRFLRRGTAAGQAEWKLLCGTHNLLRLWRHTAIQQSARPATAWATTRRASEDDDRCYRPASRAVA